MVSVRLILQTTIYWGSIYVQVLISSKSAENSWRLTMFSEIWHVPDYLNHLVPVNDQKLLKHQFRI